jgi:hypothetical protein
VTKRLTPWIAPPEPDFPSPDELDAIRDGLPLDRATLDRRQRVLELHDQLAAANRERATDIVEAIEALMRKVTSIPAVPLDVLDRYEQAIVNAHAGNLLRLGDYADVSLTEGGPK